MRRRPRASTGRWPRLRLRSVRLLRRGERRLFGQALYAGEQRGALPEAAALASLGCGNPIAVAEIHEGETVLDLGSGGGIDVLLSSRRVGPSRDCLRARHDRRDARARARGTRARRASRTSHFLKGVIEAIPLPADSVDVVISNCVDQPLADKPAVLAEIARVLKPGGRVGISDVVAEDRLTPAERAERGATSAASRALSRRASTWRVSGRRFRPRQRRVHARGRRRDARRDRQGGRTRSREQGCR